MSQSLVNQITLDCLLNKEVMGKHIIKQNEKQINKEELKFYKKRIFNLFKEIINSNEPENVSPDVKYAYNMFIKSSIDYFKVSDNNDLLQEEYKDINDFLPESHNDICVDSSTNLLNSMEADKLMMRSVKMDIPTLDKYVKRTIYSKKNNSIILPKSREVDIMTPELKNKGLKKNISNIYEDDEKNEK